MLAPVTKIDDWKASRARPAMIDCCRWSEAVEITLRANVDAWFALTMIWPRILLRTTFGV